MKLVKDIFNMLVDLFSTVFLWMLIWAGAILSLINSDNNLLGILLFLSGFAWVYKEIRNEKKKESRKKSNKEHKKRGEL